MPVTAGLHPDELHVRIVEKGGEDAERVRAAAYAGDDAGG